MTPCSQTELLIAALARQVRGLRHVAVGNASPIPAAGALLAKALSGDAMTVSLLGSQRHSSYTDGGRELFDCAGQGRLDAFFLGGGEIDGEANVNLVAIGDRLAPDVRFPGSFGSAYLYFVVPKVILFREEHSRRVLVPRVSFISAPGRSPSSIYRTGGPAALVTGRCVFGFDRSRSRFHLDSVHPGHDAAEIESETGFVFDRAAETPTTEPPTEAELSLIRGRIAAEIAETYPRFAARTWMRAA